MNDSIDSGREVAKASFVHVKYHKDGKLHDYCFYTNIEVTVKACCINNDGHK